MTDVKAVNSKWTQDPNGQSGEFVFRVAGSTGHNGIESRSSSYVSEHLVAANEPQLHQNPVSSMCHLRISVGVLLVIELGYHLPCCIDRVRTHCCSVPVSLICPCTKHHLIFELVQRPRVTSSRFPSHSLSGCLKRQQI